MKKVHLTFFLIAFCLFSCDNKQVMGSIQLKGKEVTEITGSQDTKEDLMFPNGFPKDTSVFYDNKQINIKYELINLPDEFIVNKSYGENGNEITQKIPEKRISVSIDGHSFLIDKQDISGVDSNFVKKSVFQKINFYSFLENGSTFEIILGEPDTDNIVFIYLTIDTAGNKSFRIEYPEWEEE